MDWTRSAKDAQESLSLARFNAFNKPQSNFPATTYASVEKDLFGQIVGRFMSPRGEAKPMNMADKPKEKEANQMTDANMTDDTKKPGTSAMPVTNTK